MQWTMVQINLVMQSFGMEIKSSGGVLQMAQEEMEWEITLIMPYL